jgi:hypothetical protein
MVFPGWTAWHWVALAWGQLIGAYVAYLAYMRWRMQNLKRDLDINDIDDTHTNSTLEDKHG